MNGLPKDINLQPLIGAELLQVCVGRFQYILKFDLDITIATECRCWFITGQGEKLVISDNVENASLVCSLINQNVTHAEIDSYGGLLLKFSNHATLHILNDTENYESFQIHIGDNIYVA